MDATNIILGIPQFLEQFPHPIQLEGLLVVLDNAKPFVVRTIKQVPDHCGIGPGGRGRFRRALSRHLIPSLRGPSSTGSLLFTGGSHGVAIVSKRGPGFK